MPVARASGNRSPPDPIALEHITPRFGSEMAQEEERFEQKQEQKKSRQDKGNLHTTPMLLRYCGAAVPMA